MKNIAAIVLAAGKGTRLNSDFPKVLYPIGGKPMIEYTLEKLSQLNLGEIILVVGHKADEVKTCVGPKCKYAIQHEPLGTADAVSSGLSQLDEGFDQVLVVNGDDSAFYKIETLENFIKFHQDGGYLVSIITTDRPQTDRLGRIIRDNNGNFQKTFEVWEYEKSSLHSDEVNCGVYLFNVEWLRRNIGKIDNSNDKKEYRITEALNLAQTQGQKVGLFKLKDPNEWVGVNTQEDLQKADQLMRTGHD